MCRLRVLPCAFWVLLALSAAARADTLTIGGSGGTLGLMRALAQAHEAETGTRGVIVPSLGTSGGIRALGDGKIDIAALGRDLNQADRDRGLSIVLTMTTPFGLVTSVAHPPSVAPEVIASYLAEPRSRWPDGSPIRALLRPSGQSDYLVMFARFPGTEAAVQRLRERKDVPIATNDQENLDLAEAVPGSLTGTTLMQVLTERRSLRFIPINGILPSVEAVQAGVYQPVKPVYVAVRQPANAPVTAFAAFLATPRARAIQLANGTLP
jgi:phosphate transport system substrate-binding protein